MLVCRATGRIHNGSSLETGVLIGVQELLPPCIEGSGGSDILAKVVFEMKELRYWGSGVVL